MEKLMMQMLEAAKKDKKQFLALKASAVKCQQYELGCKLREIEKDLFPETEEEKQAKQIAKETNLLLRMVELNVSWGNCWLISEAMRMNAKLKGKFSIQDASNLIEKKKILFDE